MGRSVGRPGILMVDSTLEEPKVVSFAELKGSGQVCGTPLSHL